MLGLFSLTYREQKEFFKPLYILIDLSSAAHALLHTAIYGLFATQEELTECPFYSYTRSLMPVNISVVVCRRIMIKMLHREESDHENIVL
jgi:hypothetical protein